MIQDAGDGDGRTLQSVGIAFDIIDVLQERGVTGITELASELDHSKSTIHSHLRTLETRRIIVRDDDGYRLSITILDMARAVREQIGNYGVLENEVEALAEETGEISHFGVEEHGMVSYLCKESGDAAVETASQVGTKQPIHSTAMGKTMLAYMPDERTKEIVADVDFEKRTPNTVTSPDELYEDLEQIRERGYGIDDEENVEGLRCVAAPVRNDETVLGAVSVTGPSSRFATSDLHEDLSDCVRRAANVIELNTKFSG